MLRRRFNSVLRIRLSELEQACISIGAAYGPSLASHCQNRPISYGRCRRQTHGSVEIREQHYDVDDCTNVTPNILSKVSRRLHLQPAHPLSLTRNLVESCFPNFVAHNSFAPVVTVHQNFDSLGFPAEHPGRNQTETYYVNKGQVLRTHTSAHQADVFRANESDGWLISADVYRRDAVDRSHYPVFHQMEGARLWDRQKLGGGSVAEAVLEDVDKIPKHPNVHVEYPASITNPDTNPLQPEHSLDEVEAIVNHLRFSLENTFITLFSQASAASPKSKSDETLQLRWVEAYFPFTSPSYELEVLWQGEWLEVLGCGVILQNLLKEADVPNQVGWAFGVGLERIAMRLFQIPDIRLFWSTDKRFLSQFSEPAEGQLPRIQRFVPFSKHPPCYKDVSFFTDNDPAVSRLAAGSSTSDTSPSGGALSSSTAAQASTQKFHENDLMEIVRNTAGDLVENVELIDDFTHPKIKRRSLCYRINYRSLERTLTNKEVNALHKTITGKVSTELGLDVR